MNSYCMNKALQYITVVLFVLEKYSDLSSLS